LAPAGRTLVLVTGSTRSGTSLMAGILDGLGLHVPRPVIVAKPTNPLGFFESKWSVRFHKRILARRFVNQTDGRPDAFDLVAEAVTDDDRARLRSWLERSFRETDRVVVKDPRIIWTAPLWASAAAEVGLGVGFVVMIRRPAEVVASRVTYYGSPRSERAAWTLRVRNLCTWINANLGAERQTRPVARAIVRYDEVVDDWRAVARRLDAEIGLDLASAVESRAAAVDEFVRPELNRHRVSWDGMDMPEPLVRVADEVWAALETMADGSDHSDGRGRLDAAAGAYAEQMRTAQAIAYDVASARERAGRAAGAADAAGAVRAARAGAQRSPGVVLAGLGSALRRASRRVRRRRSARQRSGRQRQTDPPAAQPTGASD
jgi:hypothetical protein